MTISIIIAAKTWQRHLEECVSKCLELDYPDFEIIILPDKELTLPVTTKISNTKGTVPIKIISTGPVSPAQKRDVAISYSKGEILAFIDDDAYPARDWLKNAIKNFIDPKIAAVGGPAVTAAADNIRQRAGGLVYSSILLSGKYVYRYLPRKKLEVDDYPSCNLLVRKSVMQSLGGFKTKFWPGEDTKLCLEITKKLGKKIIYDPRVLVYHHRRALFMPHLKQVACYALHRGYFVKRFPQTSLKVSYFIPTAFIFSILLAGTFSLFFTPLIKIYFLGLSVYLLLVVMFSISKEWRAIPLVFSGIILSHLAYGTYFLKGIFSKRLKEEL